MTQKEFEKLSFEECKSLNGEQETEAVLESWRAGYIYLQRKLLNFENLETIKPPEMLTYTHGESSGKEGQYYLTSDGQKFHEDDVIVGLDEIREYKIKNNLEI